MTDRSRATTSGRGRASGHDPAPGHGAAARTGGSGPRADAGLYGPDSEAWRLNREAMLLLGAGPRALLLQVAHPLIAEGVEQHSAFRTDPWRRLAETLRSYLRIVYGTAAVARAEIRRLNALHRSIAGPVLDPVAAARHGTSYEARDPELSLWVHATLVDSALVTYETFVKPLSRSEREDFYAESRVLGELLGIPTDRFPATLSDFDRYVNGMISEGTVRVTNRARDLARLVLRPPLRLLPGPVMIPFEVITSGLLPATLREDYGLSWGPAQKRAFALATRTVPRIVALTPPLLRVWPLPGHAVKLALTSSGSYSTERMNG